MTAVHAIYLTSDQRARIAESLKQAYAQHGTVLEDAYSSFLFEVKELGNSDLWSRMLRSNNLVLHRELPKSCRMRGLRTLQWLEHTNDELR
jgi:hypothetical protein